MALPWYIVVDMARNITAAGVTNGTVYLHFPCFDGVISAVLATDFLEKSLGWKIDRFAPVNYDRLKTWRAERLDENAAVVDFLYHPQARFWADHHGTTFVNRRDRSALRKPNGRYLFYDPDYPSCSLLLWNSLRPELEESERLAEMVHWADKIDSARYSSVREAILGDSPALNISLSLAAERGADYCDLLVRNLRVKTLAEVSELERVRDAYTTVKTQIAAGLDEVRQNIRLDGDIVICYVKPLPGTIISRYSPYYFAPDARYSVMLVDDADHAKITAMRNPWLDFESVELGKIFAKFGGGGHRRVASVLLPAYRQAQAAELVDSIVAIIKAKDDVKDVVKAYA